MVNGAVQDEHLPHALPLVAFVCLSSVNLLSSGFVDGRKVKVGVTGLPPQCVVRCLWLVIGYCESLR